MFIDLNIQITEKQQLALAFLFLFFVLLFHFVTMALVKKIL